MFVGVKKHLEGIEQHMRNKFKVKVAVMGPDDGEVLRVLNGSIKWTAEGVLYERARRHADRLVEELELKKRRSMVTPSVRDSPEGEEE